MLAQSRKDIDQDSIVQIWRNIWYRKAAGLAVNQFEFSFWQRLFQPLTTVLMICLGIPFIFGSLRTASMGSRVLLGVVVGFCFYIMNHFFGPITMVYRRPRLRVAGGSVLCPGQ